MKCNLRSQNELKRESLMSEVFPSLSLSLTLISQRGASAWLTALPMKQHNFWLHKDITFIHYSHIATHSTQAELSSLEAALVTEPDPRFTRVWLARLAYCMVKTHTACLPLSNGDQQQSAHYFYQYMIATSSPTT